ncbi:MAG TPA: ABC transporter permease, partial [Bacillota bacterium]|nr:ABC transporter permease [Bacillota bacterium]
MNKRAATFRTFYLSLFFILLYIPVLSVILYSFNKSPSTAQWTGFTLDWYRDLINDRVIVEAFKVSIQVALLTSVLSAILGTASAIIAMYATNKMEKTITGIMILPLLVPEVALGISLLIFFTALNLPFGHLTLVLSHSLFCVPYVYIMVQLRLREINISIIEAAKDLGATRMQVIRTIILPLITPSIMTASLLALAISLDDVIISTYMAGATTTTLPVHIFSMMRVGVTPKINALCTLILVGTFFIVGLSQLFNKEINYRR